MIKLKAHCLFEQSGTFKKQFQKNGIEAYDYDIQNEFGETDYVVDLYEEINNAYANKKSIFDKISVDDLIMAFFPCVRFESQILLHFRGQAYGMENWDIKRKIYNSMKLQRELTNNYILISKLVLICLNRNLKLIIENPYSEEHYLRRYWCIKATVIHTDRRLYGDYFNKPTQYWFINIKPKYNKFNKKFDNSLSGKDKVKTLNKDDCYVLGVDNVKTGRSMMHPDYANSFIEKYLL